MKLEHLIVNPVRGPVGPDPGKDGPAMPGGPSKTGQEGILEPQLQEKLSPRGKRRLLGRFSILPADGDQETYDRIFKSIRENLIDAE